jgi:hypothetical protein
MLLERHPKSEYGTGSMPPATLADAFDKARFSRNKRVIPKRERMHPAVHEAMASFTKLNGPRPRGKRR